MILHVFGEPVHVADDIADGVYSHAHVVERLIAGGAGGYPAVHYFMEAPAALRGNMLRDRPTWEDFALWCQYDGDDDRLIGDTVDRWDFTEVYMNKTFGVTRLSVLRELLERFRRTEPSPENVQDVADALKRLSMEPRSEALRIAVIEQLRRVLR